VVLVEVVIIAVFQPPNVLHRNRPFPSPTGDDQQRQHELSSSTGGRAFLISHPTTTTPTIRGDVAGSTGSGGSPYHYPASPGWEEEDEITRQEVLRMLHSAELEVSSSSSSRRNRGKW